MHIRHGNLGSAVNVMKYAVKKDLKYNTHAWQLYIDLLESGDSGETKDAYEFCMQSKIATPLMVLNYGSYL
jgi:hypothetical protein